MDPVFGRNGFWSMWIVWIFDVNHSIKSSNIAKKNLSKYEEKPCLIFSYPICH